MRQSSQNQEEQSKYRERAGAISLAFLPPAVLAVDRLQRRDPSEVLSQSARSISILRQDNEIFPNWSHSMQSLAAIKKRRFQLLPAIETVPQNDLAGLSLAAIKKGRFQLLPAIKTVPQNDLA
jgi:hypothetical protein